MWFGVFWNRIPVSKLSSPSRLSIYSALILLGAVLAYFGSDIVPIDGICMGGIDVERYFFWHELFIKEQLLSGNLPFWNPHFYSGQPFIANPQTFVFYPATLLFLVLPMAWAINIDIVLHFFLAAAGMSCFVRLLTGSRPAGIGAGLVFGLSGYFLGKISNGHLTMIHTAALLPWIFYFIEKGISKSALSYILAGGIVLGLQILGGEPQNSFYTVLFLGIYALPRILLNREYRKIKGLRWMGMATVLFIATAIGIAAIQILPSLEFMKLCDRGNPSFEFSSFVSFNPANAFTFLVPECVSEAVSTNKELSGYVGVTALVIAFVGVVYSLKRTLVKIIVFMLVLAATFALGKFTLLYEVYFDFLPGVSLFRLPTRCLVIVVFCLAVLVGLGLHRLIENKLSSKQFFVTMSAMAAMLVLVIAGTGWLDVEYGSIEVLQALGCLALGAAGLALYRSHKDHRLASKVIIAILFADLFLAGSFKLPRLDTQELTKVRQYETAMIENPGMYRVNFPIGVLRGMYFNYYSVNGYTPIVLDRYMKYVHHMAGLTTDTTDRTSLSWEIYTQRRVFSDKLLGVVYSVVQGDGRFRLAQASGALPRALIVHEAEFVPRLEDHLKKIKNESFNPRQKVLLATEPEDYGHEKHTRSSEARGELKIVDYKPNRIELSATTSGTSYVVLNELYYPGWRAFIDGEEVSVLKANYIFRAVSLNKGAHKIVFSYRPTNFMWAVLLLTITLMMFTLFLIRRPALRVLRRITGGTSKDSKTS